MGDEQVGRVVRSVTDAPLTFLWLLVLFVTTRVQRSAGRRGSRRLRQAHSTNIRRLRSEPLHALLTSLFWLDGRQWWPYVPAFIGMVAPAERRLRSGRWLFVGVAAHVIGTYFSQEHLRRRIVIGDAPRRLIDAHDVGVSYFMFGVAAALTAYLRQPWRVRCRLAALALLVALAALRPSYTQVGHLTAFVVGLAALPLAPPGDHVTLPTASTAALPRRVIDGLKRG